MVSLHINSVNLHQVIDFLVQQQVPFELKYDTQPKTAGCFKPLSEQTPPETVIEQPPAGKFTPKIVEAHQNFMVL